MSRFHTATLLLASFLLATGLTACGDEADNAGPEVSGDEIAIVPNGKADNFYSNVAAEYELTGEISVEMTAAEFADPETQAKKIAERLSAVGLYLTTFLTDKFRGIDSNNDGEISDDEVFFHNESYGGFSAMVRNYSLETLDVAGVDGEDLYFVTFSIDVAGPKGLLEALPGTIDADGKRFDLQMPAGSIVHDGDVPRKEIRRFDPSDYTGELESVSFAAKAHPNVTNAYPHYGAFMEDGVYDITLFNGHDYNDPRSDLKEAREFFSQLKGLGFKAPVDTYEELNADSGAFTRTIKASGKDVVIEVRIFHSDMFIHDRSGQHDLALKEIAERDVFFYNGHAGPYYGFYLDADGDAKVDYKEFGEYPMDASRQQLMVAQGCQTYSQYADFLYANPAKSEANLDVITTVNYSYGQGTMTVLRNLIKTDSAGNHRPVDFFKIITDINNNWINSYKDVFYGVMGIDGNPQNHPYAQLDVIGTTCSSTSECGDRSAYVCGDPGDGVKQCAGNTLSEVACPSGTGFRYIASGSTITGGACFRMETPSREVFGVKEGSPQAVAMLELVNSAPLEELDITVALDRRSARNIVAYRNGFDGVANTIDDNPIETLEELDSISWVGPQSFGKIAGYVGG